MSALGLRTAPAQVIANVLSANDKEASLLHEGQQQGAIWQNCLAVHVI